MDTIKKMLTLPAEIEIEGIGFRLTLFHDTEELRLSYELLYVEDDSPHKEQVDETGTWTNPFMDDQDCDFLYLFEGIFSDDDFAEAIEDCVVFLKENELL